MLTKNEYATEAWSDVSSSNLHKTVMVQSSEQ